MGQRWYSEEMAIRVLTSQTEQRPDGKTTNGRDTEYARVYLIKKTDLRTSPKNALFVLPFIVDFSKSSKLLLSSHLRMVLTSCFVSSTFTHVLCSVDSDKLVISILFIAVTKPVDPNFIFCTKTVLVLQCYFCLTAMLTLSWQECSIALHPSIALHVQRVTYRAESLAERRRRGWSILTVNILNSLLIKLVS